MFCKLLTANFGALAARVIRIYQKIRVARAPIYFDADAGARHDCLGGFSMCPFAPFVASW